MEPTQQVKVVFKIKANKIAENRRFQAMVLFLKKIYLYNLMQLVYDYEVDEYFDNYANFEIPDENANQFIQTVALLSHDFLISEYITVS